MINKTRAVVLTAVTTVMVFAMTAMPASAVVTPAIPAFFTISWKYVVKYIAYGYKCWPVGYGQYACY